MSALFRQMVPLALALWLIGCAGSSSVTGPGAGTAGGPVGGPTGGGGSGDGAAGTGGDGADLPIDFGPIAQATGGGDGTLGSQSSNVDMVPGFYRLFSLYFSGESPTPTGAQFNYILPSNPGKLPDAQVLKIFKDPVYKEVPCLGCEGLWVRAVNCGAYTDLDIVQMIPKEEKESNPVSDNPLLWFLLHMPRPTGDSNIVTCEGATYRDFPVKNSGVVNLEALELHPHEIVVFYLLPANPPVEVGPLSTEGTSQIPKEAIAASVQQNGLIRFVRPLPKLKLHEYMIQINPLP